MTSCLAVDLDDGGQLPSGRMVRVEEIASLPHQLRVRARLAHPPGWITLVNMETGRPLSADFRALFFWGKSRNVEGGNHAKAR